VVKQPIVIPEDQVLLTFTVPLLRWSTTFEIMTHSQGGIKPQLYFDVVYGPNLPGSQLTRVQFHAVGDENDWRVFEIDYFTPPDATEAWPSVRFR
jgi:hypothetical protein